MWRMKAPKILTRGLQGYGQRRDGSERLRHSGIHAGYILGPLPQQAVSQCSGSALSSINEYLSQPIGLYTHPIHVAVCIVVQCYGNVCADTVFVRLVTPELRLLPQLST